MEKHKPQVIYGAIGSEGAPHRSSFKASDLEQARLRLVLPMCAVAWSVWQPLPGNGPPTPAYLAPHFIIAINYLIIGILIYFTWLWIYIRAPHMAPKLRGVCLFADISAISVYTAVAEGAAIILLPIYLSAVIGYGMRFGRYHLLFALGLSVLEFSIAVQFNQFLINNTAIALTYLASIFFVPIYTLTLLRKYSDVLLAYVAASREREEFIDLISHEFRAPLHSIVSIIESCQPQVRLIQHPKACSANIRKGMQDVLRCAERMLSVANRIATARGAPNAPLDSSLQVFKSYRDVFIAIRVCAVYAKRKNISLNWHVEANAPSLTNLDSSLLQEILINLLDNSIKYTESGTVSLHVCFAPMSENEGVLAFTVTDTGVGMQSSCMQLDRSAIEKDYWIARKNAGLGLGITARSIARLSGTMKVRANQPIGTRIEVRLPTVVVPSAKDTENFWLRIAVFSTRPLNLAEETALISANFYPQFVKPSSDVDMLHILEGISFCACLGDQLSAIRSIREKFTLDVVSSLPMVLLHDGALPNITASEFSANFSVNVTNSLACSEQLKAFRVFAHGDVVPQEPQEFGPNNSGSVLLLDDSELTLESTQRILEETGYRVQIAVSIEGAIQILNQSRIDVIIADRYIGNYDFLNFLDSGQLIDYPGTRVVLLSADTDARRSVSEMGADVSTVLTKPISAITLRNTLRKLFHTFDHQGCAQGSATLFSKVDWGIFEDLFGQHPVNSERAGEVLRKFEHELLADGVRCIGQLMRNSLAELANTLHRMSGLAMLFGAVDLAEKVSSVRADVQTGFPSAATYEWVQNFDSTVHALSASFRHHYRIGPHGDLLL